MNVDQGDRAVIVFSVNPANIGRIVTVAEYIDYYSKGENFQFRGMPCQAVVDDHHWWIEAEDLEVLLGPGPRAYIADSWLRKIVEPKKKVSIKAQKELDILA